MLKNNIERATVARTEKETFNQEVLTTKTLISVPISKIKVPIKSIIGKGFFFSEMLLKKIVAISISIKNTKIKAIVTNNQVSFR